MVLGLGAKRLCGMVEDPEDFRYCRYGERWLVVKSLVKGLER